MIPEDMEIQAFGSLPEPTDTHLVIVSNSWNIQPYIPYELGTCPSHHNQADLCQQRHLVVKSLCSLTSNLFLSAPSNAGKLYLFQVLFFLNLRHKTQVDACPLSSKYKTKDEWTKTFRLAGHLFPDILAIQRRRKVEETF